LTAGWSAAPRYVAAPRVAVREWPCVSGRAMSGAPLNQPNGLQQQL
jgi:hypothetical protein